MSIPDRQHAPASIALCWALPTTLFLACGASPAAEDFDAGPPDATCECPLPTLNADTVKHVSYTLMLDPRNRFGQGKSCDEGDIAIGGSCAYRGTAPGMRLMYSGDVAAPEYPQSWWCGWYNLTQDWQELDTTVICLTSKASVLATPGCDCPEYKPIADRVARIEKTAPVQSYSTNEIVIECPPGGILLAGGCANPWLSGSALDRMTLSRSGFATEDATTWRCAWNAPVQTDGEFMLATAYCLQPPTYGTDPIEEAITHVAETTMIPANGYASFTASCAPGDFLLSGSCMLDSADPLSDQAILYHHGFDATDSNAWRCTWDNPTAMTIPATVVATCVTSLAE